MKKKILNIFIIFMLCVCSFNCTCTYALPMHDTIQGADDFLDSGSKKIYNRFDKDKLSDASSDIYNILLMVSFVVVATVGITLGIKFMMASAEERAKLKKSLGIFLIGAIVTYGSFGIWKVLVDYLNKF